MLTWLPFISTTGFIFIQCFLIFNTSGIYFHQNSSLTNLVKHRKRMKSVSLIEYHIVFKPRHVAATKFMPFLKFFSVAFLIHCIIINNSDDKTYSTRGASKRLSPGSLNPLTVSSFFFLNKVLKITTAGDVPGPFPAAGTKNCACVFSEIVVKECLLTVFFFYLKKCCYI